MLERSSSVTVRSACLSAMIGDVLTPTASSNDAAESVNSFILSESSLAF
jgi:hypothetical protein